MLCPPWCAEHFAEIGVCEAAPIETPLDGEVRMCVDPEAGQYLSLYGDMSKLTLAEAKAVAAALFAMVCRAEATPSPITIPTLIAS